MSKSQVQPALKGFQCMAVYDAPSSVTAEVAQPKKKKGAAAAPAVVAAEPLVRYLYYKAHSGSNAGDDSVLPGHTLYCVNLPAHYTTEHLTQVFACFGSVASVSFLQSTSLALSLERVGATESSSFNRTAYIVYEEADSVQMAIKTDLSRTPQQCPEEEEDNQHVGVQKWLSHYHSTHPAVASLQLQVDKFMEGFDSRSQAEKLALRKGAQQDADGWTMVTGTSRGKKRAIMAVEEETARAHERATKKHKQNTVVHFYKHQEREQKKERLIQLREKFELDKEKIAKMKADRKFKPY